MTFERTPLAQAMDDVNQDPDEILNALDRHMDDAEIIAKRELVLGIVEENINENGTVSRFDIARINEVLPENVNLSRYGSDEQVAGALNAINEGKVGIFRLVIGLLMGIAGIGMMVYGFIQQNKHHDDTISNIRSTTDALAKSALSFKTITITSSTKPVITEEVIKIYGKIKDLWWQSVGDGAPELPTRPEEFLKDPIYPWSQKTKEVQSIVITQLWSGQTPAIRKLASGLQDVAIDLAKSTQKVEKYLDDFSKHLAKGEPLPRNFPAPEEMFYIKNPFGEGRILPSIREGLLEASQCAWPLRYKASELTNSAASKLASGHTAFQIGLTTRGLGAEIADSCTLAMDMGTNSADAIKEISELSTKMASRLKVLEDKAKDGLSKLEGMDRGDYNVTLKKINVQISELNTLSEVINRTIVNGTTMSKKISAFLTKMKNYDDLVSKMRYAAMKAGGEADAKASGNNSFGLPGLNSDGDFLGGANGFGALMSQQGWKPTIEQSGNDDEMPTAIITREDEVQLDQYVKDIDFEIQSIDKLHSIAERLQESGTISRSDVDEIEKAAPGLMALIPDQPNFTFRQSTVGLDAGLNAIGNHISAKGGIIAAVIAAIVAVIGFIIAKIFGGKGGAGKESTGIMMPPAEAMKVLDDAMNNAESSVTRARARNRANADELHRQWDRDQEELKAKQQEANAEEAKRLAAEIKANEEKQKQRAAEFDAKQRELRIRSPQELGKGNPDEPYIYSVDKADAHLSEPVLQLYKKALAPFSGYLVDDSIFAKRLSVTWLLKARPSVFARTSAESVNRYYNSFIYAPDAVKRVVEASKACVEVGQRIREMSDYAANAHKCASKFWVKYKPREFRTMDQFNRAMADSGLGEALAKVKEHSQALVEDAATLGTVRGTLKYDFIDVTKEEEILKANPVPVQLEALNAEYAAHTLPKSILPFREVINEIGKLMDEEDRHQSYDGGMRSNGGFYLANNVYGSDGLKGDGKGGRGVNLELRKELMGKGMPAEVFAAIARIEREQVDFVNQAHRRIQGVINSAAYITGDVRSYYENAVSLSRRNVQYMEAVAELAKALEK